jgi:7,8-dihydropterin-6-yl-methyl-4-(beta-D-ribofuranosyl)aminobenzene 5'-phosphate synthase
MFGGGFMPLKLSVCLSLTLALMPSATVFGAQTVNRVTILVDAFGKPSELKMDWGFSAFVEHGGKRILFDTGNNAEIFARNVKALGVDLTRLDFVVISHRHGDHTDGLRHLLKVNPKVKIYAPNDEHFGGPTPPQFYRRGAASLPPHMRYFGGVPPEDVPHGSVWAGANIERVSRVTEIAPGIKLIPTGSQEPGAPLPELSLSVRTTKGQVLLVGCSHPGVENILASSSAGSIGSACRRPRSSGWRRRFVTSGKSRRSPPDTARASRPSRPSRKPSGRDIVTRAWERS